MLPVPTAPTMISSLAKQSIVWGDEAKPSVFRHWAGGFAVRRIEFARRITRYCALGSRLGGHSKPLSLWPLSLKA